MPIGANNWDVEKFKITGTSSKCKYFVYFDMKKLLIISHFL